MAKKCQFARERKRRELREKYAEKRAELVGIMKSQTASQEEKMEALAALQKLPRNASPVRHKNRCSVTGRSRGYLRKYGISRIKFRDLALEGKIPGVSKSSW